MRDPLQAQHRRVPGAPFDLTDVRPVEPRALTKLFLA